MNRKKYQAYLCAVFMAWGQAVAIPLARECVFDAPSLPDANWDRSPAEGDSVHVDAGELWMTPGEKAPASAVYRYYGKRDYGYDAQRPFFGPFSSRLTIREGNRAPVGFGLKSGPAWALELIWEPNASKAWIQYSTPEKATRSAAVSIPESSGDVQIEWVSLRGELQGRMSVNGGTILIGSWRGEPPPIVDFSIVAHPSANRAPLVVKGLAMDPLPKTDVSLEIMPRTGIEPDAAGLPAPLSETGAILGGYIWPRNAGAKLDVRLNNLKRVSQSLRLVHRVFSVSGDVLREEERPLSLPAAATMDVEVPLPAGSYGFFTASVGLRDGDGARIAADQFVQYCITAARLPRELSDANPFGVHGLPFGRIGAKWVRFWDTGRGMQWSGMEPEKGKWDWSLSDAFVERTLARDMKPLIVLGMTPEWAARDTSRQTHMGKGAYSPPADINDWIAYCKTVAARYKGRVSHYEIWNEPNNSKLATRGYFFHGTAEDYFAILKAGYRAIKATDPEAKVLAPSGTGHFFPFLHRVMELGGGDYFDILSIHTYTTPFPPEIGYQFNGEKDYRHRVNKSREILREFGFEKPIWNTEVGFNNRLAPSIGGIEMSMQDIADEALPEFWPNWKNGWDFRPVNQSRAAAFAVRFGLLTKELGVEKLFYHHRLMRLAERSPYAMAPAVGWMSTLLGDATFDQRYRLDASDVRAAQLEASGFRLPDGRYVIALWRVEPESLLMGLKENDGQAAALSGIDSAPIESATDTPVISGGIEPGHIARNYFKPDRRLPVGVQLDLPCGGYDGWGNEIPASAQWPISEMPVYLVFPGKPASFSPRVVYGVPAVAKSAMATLRDKKHVGALDDAAPLLEWPSNPAHLYGKTVPVRLRDAQVGQDGRVISISEIVVGKSGVKIPLPGEVVGQGAFLLLVRTGDRPNIVNTFNYGIEVGDVAAALSMRTDWPVREIARGKGYSVFKGAMVSPRMNVKPQDRYLQVFSSRGQGRLYALWWVPADQ